MKTEQVLSILDKDFSIGERYGNVPKEEICILLYLMFIDEYYEIRRDFTVQDAKDPRGLSDDLVKHLNNKISQIIECSNTINSNSLDDLQSALYWIIPDVDKDYVKDHILYTHNQIKDYVLNSYGDINDYILQL